MISLLLSNVLLVLILSLSVVFADDFRTLTGKEYKDARVIRVESDGIMIKTKSGVSKIYFSELPREVQEHFHYNSQHAAQSTTQTSQQTQQLAIAAKAQSIRIPYIEFRDAALREAIDVLRELGQENDKAGTGVNINIELKDTSPNASPIPRIMLSLQDVTLFQAVTAVAQQLDLSVNVVSFGLHIYCVHREFPGWKRCVHCCKGSRVD